MSSFVFFQMLQNGTCPVGTEVLPGPFRDKTPDALPVILFDKIPYGRCRDDGTVLQAKTLDLQKLHSTGGRISFMATL